MNHSHELERGLDALGLEASATVMDQMLAFLAELAKWNQVYNLTGVADDDAVSHHLLDSLSLVPHVAANSLIDVGSGGGLPGVPLALWFPEMKVTLLDSNGKKTRFLEHVRMALNLRALTVVQCRAEDFDHRFDVVTCRAFASLADISKQTAHLLNPGGRVLAMKGVFDPADRQQEVPPLVIDRVIPLAVPGIDAARHLVVMEQVRS